MTVLIDVLNQLSLLLRDDSRLAQDLRSVLGEMSSLEEYNEWLRNGQYYGGRFRVPRRFLGHSRATRRLLEELHLVVDDLLTVRVNAISSGQQFVTDGLFVSPYFRVFPFADESDRIAARIEQLRWDSWANIVIDPAMGCGHNLLRYSGGSDRVGLDISVRAVAFAAVNAALNDVETRLLGVQDIQSGLPPVRAARQNGNVLFLINMPFALEPEPSLLVRSAAGGRLGYELTASALKAIDRFRKRQSKDVHVRAIVLTYSIGKNAKGEGSWVVPEVARETFGKDHVTWTLLENEKLWRVNGKKEQPNPMPLERLSTKADCKFYIRDDSRRDDARRAYEALTRELKGPGNDYTHLAYGLVAVDLPAQRQ